MAVKPGAINKFGRVGVLMGGPSSEREISFKSGKAVLEALKTLGLEVVPVEIKSDGVKENINLLKTKKIDCAFIALHGRFGEDGQIQSILGALKIPYTGSGVFASRLAMDKVASRSLFEAWGLKVPRYKVLNKASCRRALLLPEDFGFPLVIKPVTHGSSIGMSIINKGTDFSRAVRAAFAFDQRVIIEEYIRGRELTVGILDERPLPVIEIVPKKKFFDYEAKYKAGMTDYVVPAKLEGALARRVQKAALECHKILGCFGCSRVDLILSGKDPVILEINTIPGFTSTSLLPKAAGTVGIGFNELCVRLIKLAYEKAKDKSAG